MPMVTVFNLRSEDRLTELEGAITRALTSMPELEGAITRALTSMPELAVADWDVNVVPVLQPDGFEGEVTRINVDLWERPERRKQGLQELATRIAMAFQSVAGEDRRVKVVIAV